VTEKKKVQPLEKELAIELEHLRLLFREVLAAYSNRVEGRIVHVIEALQDVPDLKLKPSKSKRPTVDPIMRDVQAMLHSLHSLKVKPDKGRRKDLRHIEEALSSFLSLIESW